MKLLLVEDNPADARLIREMLRESPSGSFQVQHVERLQAALEQLRLESFDSVLLDLALPDSQGLQTLTAIRQAIRSVPIVILTGLDDEPFALEAMRVGAQDYLVKGRFDTPLLARTIRYAVQRKGAEEEIHRLNADLERRVAERTAQLQTANGELLAEIAERKRVEEALRQSEERFRSVLENMSEGLMLFDAAGNLTYQNPASLQIHGFRGEDEGRIGREKLSTTWEAWDEKERAITFDEWPVSRVFRHERFRDQVLHVRRVETGMEFFGSYNGCPIYDSEGKLIAGFITTRDITEELKAGKALRESERRFRSLFVSMDEGFCVIELMFDKMGKPNDWKYLEVNPAFERHNGLEQATGRTIRELVPNIESRWFDIYGKVALTGEAIRFVEFSQAFERWFDVYAFRVGEPEQRRVAVLFNNITEQKRAEEALRKSETWFRSIFEMTADLICVADMNGRFQMVNPAFERAVGYSGDELVSRPFLEFVHPDDRDKTRQVVKDRLEQGITIMSFENRYVRKDGGFVWLEWSSQPLDAKRTLAVARDITERKRTEEALIRSEKLAATGRLAATIAHEVNNPLAAAMNSVYLASNHPTASAPVRETLIVADQELRRAAHITRQTLGFYRENGNRTPVALPKLIDEVVGIYARKLQDRNITIQRRYKCGPCRDACEGCFLVNPGEMRQIISNLLANGMDALANNGTMHIRVARLARPDGSPVIQLTIADNGCGIRSENLKRIFEPFFTTKESIGTGLGLWITEELVRKHNGSIKVRSQKGKGTVFRITIPAMAATGEVIAATPTPERLRV